MKNKSAWRAFALLVSAVLFAACSVSQSGNQDKTGSGSKAAAFDLSAPTKGPNGEASTSVESIPALTDAEIAKVKAAQYKVAFLNAGTSTWYNSMQAGATAEIEQLGMKVASTAQADFDPAKQTSQVETAMAQKPDIIVTLPVDPVSAAQAFKPAVAAGVKIVMVDNGINGYTAGKQYVSIVTGDHYRMGEGAADLMDQALGGKGKIGYIFHDADFYVTNNRDKAFKAAIEQKYPQIKIVASAGFTAESQTSDIASTMLTRHPDLDGIYVSWSAAATGVLAALRDAGNNHVKVTSIDLDATNDVQIAKGGNLFGVTADRPFQEGQTMIRLAAMSLLGKQTPPFVVVKVVTETRDTVDQAWRESLNQQPPAAIADALKK
jgi:ribose transport system substrate-binding protein